MKKLSLFMMFLALLFGAGCEGPAGEEGLPGPTGPVGPVGPVGPAGPAGASSRAASFVIEEDLAAPNYLIAFAYSDLVDFPIEVGLDDVMLVYRARILGEAANPILAWFPLPETFNLAQGGTLGYTYAALEFGEDPGLLIALSASETTITGLTANQRLQYLDGQVFKIVIIPSDLLNGKKTIPGVDFNNHDAVVKYLGLDDKKTRRVKIKK